MSAGKSKLQYRNLVDSGFEFKFDKSTMALVGDKDARSQHYIDSLGLKRYKHMPGGNMLKRSAIYTAMTEAFALRKELKSTLLRAKSATAAHADTRTRDQKDEEGAAFSPGTKAARFQQAYDSIDAAQGMREINQAVRELDLPRMKKRRDGFNWLLSSTAGRAVDDAVKKLNSFDRSLQKAHVSAVFYPDAASRSPASSMASTSASPTPDDA